ncbi:MAG: hypothetical protein ACYC8V_06435, partial [Caulobacteraceae bacterium]
MQWRTVWLLAAIFSVAAFSVAAQTSETNASDCGCWIDAQTGRPVPTAPASGVNQTVAATIQGAGAAQFDPLNPNRAHNPNTGQSFVRKDECSWIDAQTGRLVPTAPASGVNQTVAATIQGAGAAQFDPLNPNRAHNPKTGQSFVRVPCPPPTSPQPPEQNAGCKTAVVTPSAGSAAILNELNLARTRPGEYAQGLAEYRTFFHGKLVSEPGRPLAATNEGTAAVDDAIAFVRRQKPLA